MVQTEVAKRQEYEKYSYVALSRAYPSDYVALDFETTGLSPEKDRIVQIGAVKVRNQEIEDSFTCMFLFGTL